MRTIHPRSRTLLAAGLLAGIALSGSVTANAGTSSAPQARSGATCADPGTGRDSLKVIGLTDFQRLMCFDENTPGQITNIGRISGLEDDVRIVGIDHRPASGDLYGLGDQGGVYVLDETDASADLRSRLNVELGGGQYDIDFNPTVDRLRIVSNMGQNLRANVDDGATIVDGPLNSAGPPPVNPVRGVGGAADTNNDADANTATTLFDIDGLQDQVVIQAPANSGSLSATGKLGGDYTGNIGFDIYSTTRRGTTVDVEGYATLRTAQGSGFFDINLLTGRAERVGMFNTNVVDIAIPLGQL